MSHASPNSPAKAFTTAWSSTASSPASWRRAAIPAAPAAGSKKPDLKAEFSKEPHVRGTCSMARTSNPNSANSQFFICFGDSSFLDGQYTVWGEVTGGMEHVDALPKGEPPRSPGKILKATVA